MFLDLIDPHFPYRAPDRFVELFNADVRRLEGLKERVMIAGGTTEFDGLEELCHAEVHSVAAVLEQLFDWMRAAGSYDQALIVLTSNQREEHVGEQGRFSHQLPFQEELLRISLLIKYPNGRVAGTREVDSQASNAVADRTLLAAAGAKPLPSDAALCSQELTDMRSLERTRLVAENDYSPAHLRLFPRAWPGFAVDWLSKVHRVVLQDVGRFGLEWTRSGLALRSPLLSSCGERRLEPASHRARPAMCPRYSSSAYGRSMRRILVSSFAGGDE